MPNKVKLYFQKLKSVNFQKFHKFIPIISLILILLVYLIYNSNLYSTKRATQSTSETKARVLKGLVVDNNYETEKDKTISSVEIFTDSKENLKIYYRLDYLSSCKNTKPAKTISQLQIGDRIEAFGSPPYFSTTDIEVCSENKFYLKLVSRNDTVRSWLKREVKKDDYSYEFEYPSNWQFDQELNNILLPLGKEYSSQYFSVSVYYQDGPQPFPRTYNLLRQIITGDRVFDVKQLTKEPYSKFLTEILNGNYNATIYASEKLASKYDFIFDRIVTGFKFTYTKPSCGNVIDEVSFKPPTDWKRVQEGPCSSLVSFYSPDATRSEFSSLSGASISINKGSSGYGSFNETCEQLKTSEGDDGSRRDVDCTKTVKGKKVIYSTYGNEGYSLDYEIWVNDKDTYTVSLESKTVAESNKFLTAFNEFLNNLKFN